MLFPFCRNLALPPFLISTLELKEFCTSNTVNDQLAKQISSGILIKWFLLRDKCEVGLESYNITVGWTFLLDCKYMKSMHYTDQHFYLHIYCEQNIYMMLQLYHQQFLMLHLYKVAQQIAVTLWMMNFSHLMFQCSRS